MPPILLDLSRIAALATEKELENKRFAKFLRQFPTTRIDALVASLNDDIEPKIDCKACANCCKGLYAAAFEDELPALAQAKGLSLEAFKQAFVRPYKNAYYFNAKPCPMLRDNLCIAYAERPICCQTFPNLKGEHFKYRFQSAMEKYAICPIVFNVVEALKEALSFQKNSDV